MSEQEKAFFIIQNYMDSAQSKQGKTLTHQLYDVIIPSSQLTAPKLVKSLPLMEIEGQVMPECKTFSKAEVFEFNQLIWAVGYVWLGIQFTHSDQGILQKFVLDW